MTLVVVNQGEEAFLDLVLAVNYTLRLFTNDVTAGLTQSQIDALDETDFVEATFPGYAGSAITGGTWTTTPADPSTGANTQRTFTRTSTGAAQLVRGYYLVTTTGGLLRWFEQFPAPVSVEFANDQVLVTPRITLDDRSGSVSVPIGGSILWSGPTSSIPAGWLLRDGSAVSRSAYPLLNALYAAAGYPYGDGDGSTTFNVPDSRQRVPLGVAASGTGATLGATGGAIDHVHGLDTASSHAKYSVSVDAVSNDPLLRRKSGVTAWTATHAGGFSAGSSAAAGNTIGLELGGDSDTENPPFLAEYFIVRAL